MKFFEVVTPRRMAIALLAVPALAATVYFSFIAQSRYASTTVMSIVDSSGGISPSVTSLSSLLGGAAPASHADALTVQSYIYSADLLAKLDKQFNLREHYSRPWQDVFFRLSPRAGREDFLLYWQSRISMSLDDFSGLLTIEVQAFDADTAQKLAKAILVESEAFVNDNAHRIARDKMAFADSEVQRALARVHTARSDLVAFQAKYKLLDPISQAAASGALTASLQATQAQQESALKAALSYMSEDNLQVRALRSQLSATVAQLDVERLRATAVGVGNQLPTLAVQYQSLLTQAGFADDAYRASVLSYEQSRLDATRKLKTVVITQAPTPPDLPTYPRRLIDWLTALAVFGLCFAILRLVYATIREHQD
jgi:capsular polysaccharide transport system permease protein